MRQPIVPERLRRLRTRAGLTQAELGARVGTSPSAIQNYERGIRAEPRGDILARMVAVLNTNTDYLTGVSPDPDPMQSVPAEWAAAIAEARRRGFTPADALRAFDLLTLARAQEGAPGTARSFPNGE